MASQQFRLYCDLCDGKQVGEFEAVGNIADVLFPHFHAEHGWSREQVSNLNYFSSGSPIYRYIFYTDSKGKDVIARGEPVS